MYFGLGRGTGITGTGQEVGAQTGVGCHVDHQSDEAAGRQHRDATVERQAAHHPSTQHLTRLLRRVSKEVMFSAQT